ncbi:hypothetical protein NDU88_003251 [Pleurodeles waltl]|uniref:Uncharacterized protein n=1 Tax=Pleurodeles waltl TaxID=8319 RepID=A0AAV7W4F9_PLEWA|nr:hypothetical protein NDU88_003251 [Pleurodeles waltl]
MEVCARPPFVAEMAERYHGCTVDKDPAIVHSSVLDVENPNEKQYSMVNGIMRKPSCGVWAGLQAPVNVSVSQRKNRRSGGELLCFEHRCWEGISYLKKKGFIAVSLNIVTYGIVLRTLSRHMDNG